MIFFGLGDTISDYSRILIYRCLVENIELKASDFEVQRLKKNKETRFYAKIVLKHYL